MDSGLLIALAFAVAIILLAIVLTWLTRKPDRKSGSDVNGSRRDGDAAATWIAIDRASSDPPPDR